MQAIENKMGVMPINKLIFNMSLPIMASMLVQALYNIVDSIFVSMIEQPGVTTEEALSAVSTAFPIQNLLIAVATGTGVGLNALISRSLGEKNNERANKIAQNGVFLGVMSFVLFVIIGIFAVRPFFEAQTHNEVIIEQGIIYTTIVSVASIGIFMEITFERLMQSTGKTIYTMFTQGTGAIINIILDPIFIFGFDMGVAGAAIATVIGQIAAGIIGILFNHFKNKEIKVKLLSFRPDFKIIREIYAIGIPSIIMASIGSVMYFGVNKILYSMANGVAAATVFGVYFKLQSFIFMPVFGLNNGLIPIIGYNYGARNRKRIMKTFLSGTIFAVSLMLIGVILFQFFPELLLGCFNATEAMLEIGAPALRTISMCFVFAGVCIVIGSLFQAFGKGVSSMLVSITRQLLILLPAAYLLSLSGEVRAVWWAFPIAEIGSLLISIFLFLRLYRKIIRHIPDGNE